MLRNQFFRLTVLSLILTVFGVKAALPENETTKTIPPLPKITAVDEGASKKVL